MAKVLLIRKETNLLVDELRLQYQPLHLFILPSQIIGSALTSLDAHDHLAHDLEFAPVDPVPILANESAVAMFGSNKVAA